MSSSLAGPGGLVKPPTWGQGPETWDDFEDDFIHHAVRQKFVIGPAPPRGASGIPEPTGGGAAGKIAGAKARVFMSTILSNDAFNFSGGVPCALFVNKMPARFQLSAGPRGGLKTFAKLAERAGLDAANFDERPGAHDEPRALPPRPDFKAK